MLRAVLLLLSAAGALAELSPPAQPAVAAPHQHSSYQSVRESLDAARASGTLPEAQARLLRETTAVPALRWYAEGYAALLVYDRARADEALARSFEMLPSAHVAAALTVNASEAGRQAACIDWGTRGLAVDADRSQVWAQVELRVTRGTCFFHTGQHSAHRADVDEAVKVATDAGHAPARALALRALGTALTNAGQPDRARPVLDQAIAIDEQTGDRQALAQDLLPYPSERFADRLPQLDRAVTLAVSVHDRLLEGRLLGVRGGAHILLGRYGAAHRDLLAADAIAQQVGAVRNRASHTGNLSLLFRELGDYDKAEEQARLSMALYRKAENPAGVRQVLSDLGNLGRLRFDLDTALRYQLQVVDLNRALGDRLFQRNVLLRLGYTHIARKEWNEAESAFRESLALSQEAGQAGQLALAHAGLADLLRLTNRAEESSGGYANALVFARGSEHEATLEVRANHGLGLLHAAAGRTGKALVHYRTALGAIERIRDRAQRTELQVVYFADKHALYTDAINALFDADKVHPSDALVREAFMLAERAKARALLDAMTAGPEADAPASVAAIAASLDPSDLLVEFVLGAEHSFVFTLAGQGEPTMHRLPGRSTLERLVTDLRTQVGRRPAAGQANADAELQRAGEALYDAALRDALGHAGRAGPVQRLIIVGDGLLFYAPFEAVRRPGERGYLGEQFEIARAASASVLAVARARDTTPLDEALPFVGFGDPVVEGSTASDDVEVVRALERSGFSFAPLPGSAREVSAVAGLFGPGRSRVYTGRAFTAAAALEELQRPNRIVHFATHAILDERVPGRSGILVSQAGAGVEPVLLRAKDLARLTVRADLITLSGCQTGLGQVVGGEGVIGLAWALGRAGAGSLMVTLWNVSDAASGTMMVAFYRALRDGQTKTAALRTARLEMLRSPNPAMRHPYYWAGYALMGKP